MSEALKSIELTNRELEFLEEDDRCSSHLMCVGLTNQNLPAQVGWYLTEDPNTGHDVPRTAYTWRFEGFDGVYCEDCTIEIERLDADIRDKWEAKAERVASTSAGIDHRSGFLY